MSTTMAKKSLSGFKDFILKKHPNMPKAQRDQLEDFIKEQSTVSAISEGNLTLQDIPAEQRGIIANKLSEVGVTPESRKEKEYALKRKDAYRNVAPTLKTLFEEFEAIPADQKGAVIGSIYGNLPYTEASTYKKGLSSLGGSIKSLVGEAGPLTDYDIQRIVDTFPQPGDTPKQVTIKKERLNKIFTERFDQPLFEEEAEEGAAMTTARDRAAVQPQMPQEQSANPLEQMLTQRGQLPQGMGKQIGDVGQQMLGGVQQANPMLSPAISAMQSPMGQNTGKFFSPRTYGAGEAIQQDQIPSVDELAGVGGELGAGALAGGAGGIGNLMARLGLAGGIHGVTTPGKSANERVTQGGIEGLLGMGAGAIGQYGPKLLSKVRHPIQNAGAARMKAAPETIKGNPQVQKVAKDMLTDRVATYNEKNALEKLASGKGISGKEAVDLMSTAGRKTFTKGGDYKTNRASDYYQLLREGLRTDFAQQAPEVLKQTTNMSRLIGAQDFLSKNVGKAAIGAGVGIPISMALYNLFGGGRR